MLVDIATIRLPCSGSSSLVTLQGPFTSPNELHFAVAAHTRLPVESFRLTTQYAGNVLEDDVSISHGFFDCQLSILGGKGGFGSMLRSQGGRMAAKQSNNFGSCRDLSGHRLRTLDDAKMLAEFQKREEEMQRERQEKLKRKIERGMELKENPKKQIKLFDDPTYRPETEEIVASVSTFVDSGFQQAEVRAAEEANRAKQAADELKQAETKLSQWDEELDIDLPATFSSSDSEDDAPKQSNGNKKTETSPVASKAPAEVVAESKDDTSKATPSSKKKSGSHKKK